MAVIGMGREHKVQVGDDGLITLREPTNKEWNDYQAAAYQVKGRKIKNEAVAARAALFDKLGTKIENIQTPEGTEITLESLDLIPARDKSDIIFRVFEDREDIDVKNS